MPRLEAMPVLTSLGLHAETREHRHRLVGGCDLVHALHRLQLLGGRVQIRLAQAFPQAGPRLKEHRYRRLAEAEPLRRGVLEELDGGVVAG